MPIDLSRPAGLMLALTPELILSGLALVVLLVVSWRHRTAADSRLAGWLSAASLVVTLGAVLGLAAGKAQAEGLAFMVALDEFRYLSSGILLVASLGSVLVSLTYLERERLIAPEYYVLILLAVAGMLFMTAAQDLIVLFLGLETMSVAVYVLAGYNRADRFSAEAALKYFLIGAFASGFLLYGIALVYGSTGSTNLVLIAGQLARPDLPLLAAVGLGLLIVGFGFKVAAVPFHMWAPDAYDGAPTPVTGFMAASVKVAGFAAFARVLLTSFSASVAVYRPILWVLATASMVLGNLVALNQPSLKRMLAYSSIAHAGYLLTALWTGTPLGAAGLLLYLLGYGVTTVAAFAIVGALGRGGERDLGLADLAGLGQSRPWLALALAVCMLSLLGFPGTLGFIGKWYILTALVAEKQYVLSVILVVTSVVSAGYYLPVIMAMYMRPARAPLAFFDRGLPRAAAATVAVAVLVLLGFGFWPTPALQVSEYGAGALIHAAGDVAAR
ncbi:MAG TPA: NADH-quinone oxidoreductase subunit N [Gemmatimonadales bacterium]|nr:NADH-quinone oxidoreductase subunit N [Gemmatimonadales bacterium]